MTRWREALLSAAAASLLSSCAPLRVSFDVGFAREGVHERVVQRDPGAGTAAVALIPFTGLIADAPQPPGLLGGGPNPVDRLVASLERASKDPHVRAVVLRVNSPGGSVTGSDILYREITRFRERTGKPVVVSMGEVAASGGYYISLAADRILAEPTTITGSVGVLFQTFNVHEALTRFGVQPRAITSGPNKDLANPFAPPRQEHYALLQQQVDALYQRFRQLVLSRRPAFDAAQADELLDGRVFTGQQAADLGLVDAVGGVREAFEAAKRLAGIARATLVMYYSGRSAPHSPYAQASLAPSSAPVAASPASTPASSGARVTLEAQLGSSLLTPGFHYLWAPGLP